MRKSFSHAKLATQEQYIPLKHNLEDCRMISDSDLLSAKTFNYLLKKKKKKRVITPHDKPKQILEACIPWPLK